MLPSAAYKTLVGRLGVSSFHQPRTRQSLVMKMEIIIRRFAGTFILASLLLANYHSLYWLWFTAFVGFNLLQSSFTGFCPLEMALRKLGVGGTCGAASEQPSSVDCAK